MKTDMIFKEHGKDGLVYMTAKNIKTVHAFTTRYGGVSEGIYESLNLRSNLGDDLDNVRENYRRLYDALDIPEGRLVASKQVHGGTVRIVTEEDIVSPLEEFPVEADGMITDAPNLPLIVYTADCIPILLHDPVRNIIGAVHAGWRSTAAGIAGEAVRKMVDVFDCEPKNICAAIGPGIDFCCFETDVTVPKAMMELGLSGMEECIFPRGEKFHVDLKKINAKILEKAGVKSSNIAISDECTMCYNDKYWSHRYTGGKRGSQASIIMLKGNS